MKDNLLGQMYAIVSVLVQMPTHTAAPSTCLALAALGPFAYSTVSPLASGGQCAPLRVSYRSAALELILRATALIWLTRLLQLDLCLEKSGKALSSPSLQLSYRRGAEEEPTGQGQHSNRWSEIFKYIDLECLYFWASKISHCKKS